MRIAERCEDVRRRVKTKVSLSKVDFGMWTWTTETRGVFFLEHNDDNYQYLEKFASVTLPCYLLYYI